MKALLQSCSLGQDGGGSPCPDWVRRHLLSFWGHLAVEALWGWKLYVYFLLFCHCCLQTVSSSIMVFTCLCFHLCLPPKSPCKVAFRIQKFRSINQEKKLPKYYDADAAVQILLLAEKKIKRRYDSKEWDLVGRRNRNILRTGRDWEEWYENEKEISEAEGC